MLSARHLRKTFATTVAVDDVSFEVGRGEIFGLLGPNGAGKTTTIRIILNILEPDSGEVLYEGKGFSPRTRDLCGYLPEERGLYRKSTVLDTVLYFAELRGLARSAARTKALEWLRRVGLAERWKSRVEELSKGNQQKIQFVCSVIHEPALLVLDEPFSGFDPVNQMLFQEIIQEQKRLGRAIIFSTHQMDQAERLSDAICLIDHGRVVLSGPVREVKQRYGHNSLHVEFDGDGTLLERLPGVRGGMVSGRAAELEIADGTRPQEVIAMINDAVELRKVELREPSLNSIFLRMVGAVEAPPPAPSREDAP